MSKLLIEVGAFDGSDSLRYYKEGYSVYTFEPNKVLFNNLYEKTKNISNYTVINKAVCLEDGEMDFYICKAGGASSLLKFKDDKELIKHWGTNRTDIHYSNETYKVKTTRLDTFIEQNGLTDTTIDFLHVDAQGVDLDVLKSMGKYLQNVKAGVVETVKNVEKSIYLEQVSTFTNIEKFLNNNNFKIVRIDRNDPTNCEFNVTFERRT